MLILPLVAMKVDCFSLVFVSHPIWPLIQCSMTFARVTCCQLVYFCFAPVGWYLDTLKGDKRGVIQKSIAHFSSLDVAAKVIFPEFAQVSLLAGLREPAIIMPTYGCVIVENYHTRWTTMHNIFLPPLLLCARLQLAKLPTVSFHIFIFQT